MTKNKVKLEKKNSSNNLSKTLILGLIGLILLLIPASFNKFIGLIVGFSLLLIGIIQIIKYVKNKDSFSNIDLISGILYSALGIIIILNPHAVMELVTVCLGIYLIINSSYRPYTEQEQLYNEYTELYGQRGADTIASRPGYSEHQTGLALDIFSKDSTTRSTFKDSAAYTWLINNSYKYGFILRYPEGKESLTGFEFEAWHYRYVGKKHAKAVHEKNITYDEYYAYYLDK